MPQRINLGLLSRDELELIRAKIAGGSFDELDAGALLDHIDYLTQSAEEIVQRSAHEADRAQALLLANEEVIAERTSKLRRACQSLAIKHNNPNCACEFCEELRTEHHDGYDIVNAAPAAGA